jgi:hypothetical protein
MAVVLSDESKSRLKPQIDSFVAHLATEAAKKEQLERQQHLHYFREELPALLDNLSELDVANVVGQLWASRMWGNKQWLVQRVIEDNRGLDVLREELKHLLDTTKSPGYRYERALSGISRLGPASITEILCYSDPEHCGIWNNKARAGVKSVGLDMIVSSEKYRLSGTEYDIFNALLAEIGNEIKVCGVPSVDLLLVDYFLYQLRPKTSSIPAASLPSETFDHDELRDLLASIGTMLGFDVQTEQRIAYGAVADTVWRARIGNLGIVTYVFEVHKSGSIDSLLMNLQKARRNPTVQKVIAVSDDLQLQRISREAEALHEEFRRALTFWPVREVLEVADHLQRAGESIEKLGLVPGFETASKAP